MKNNNYHLLEEKKDIAEKWFSSLRNSICLNFEKIENSLPNNNSFEVSKWKREGGGGGKMSVLKGEVFEKVGVNISTVHGVFSESFRSSIPGAE